MTITDYNAILQQYNAAWKTVCDQRTHVQQADAYLSAYGVAHYGNELHFHINPGAHIDPASWATAEAILAAVAALKDIGERVVAAYNHLTLEDRYLVTLPKLQ